MDEVQEFAIWAALAGIAGARIWEVVFTWDNYSGRPWSVLAVWEGGLSVQGGLVGGILAGAIFARIRRIPVWQFADLLAPGVILGMAIGRVGCLMAGDCYGSPTTVPWAVSYPPGTIAYAAMGGVPLHPTVIYEAIVDLAVVGFCLWYDRRKPFVGATVLSMAALYSVGRFFVEFFRADSLRTIANLRTAQISSVLAVAVIVACWWWRTRHISRTE